MFINKLNSEVCEQALEGFLKGIGRASLQSLDQAEMESNLMLKLLGLSLTEREALTKVASRFIKVEVDTEAMNRQLQSICDHSEGDKLENNFLIQGAPVAMMRELFGMHATEFSRRRSILGLKGENRGRPKSNADAEVEIWDIWYDLRDYELRERYLKAAQLTGESMLTIWTAVKKYNLYAAKSQPGLSSVRSVA